MSFARVMTSLLFCVTAATIHAEQPSSLTLPQSADDMRKYMAPTDARCPGCGVVTNVRQVAPRAAAGQGNLGGADVRTGDAGPGDDIKPVTIAGTGDQSKQARRQAAKSAPRPWQVTVRYDDGSYGAFEQDDPPRVSKGQRVQVVSGRVEPR